VEEKTIEECWEAVKKVGTAESVPDYVISTMRKCFYVGAISAFNIVSEAVVFGDATKGDAAITMHEIYKELTQFSEELSAHTEKN
jgi:hypothetical protein